MIYNDRFYKIEMLILNILKHDDYSCAQIKTKISEKTQQYFQIKSGLLITSLYYMKNAELISESIQDDDFVYHIESAGLVRLDTLKRQYKDISYHLDCFLKENSYE